MSWKQSLDRYLTAPPDDGLDSFAEELIELIDEDVIDGRFHDFIGSDIETRWLNKMYDLFLVEYPRGDGGCDRYGRLTIEELAKIYSRAYRLYFIHHKNEIK